MRRAGLRYTLIGGQAVNAWGSPRITEDFDFLVAGDRAAIAFAEDLLRAAGFVAVTKQDAGSPSGPDFVRMRQPERAVIVDLLVAKTSYQEALIERARAVNDSGVPVATPEDLIVLKLIAGRSKDNADAQLLARRPDLDREYLEARAREWGLEARLRDLLDSAGS